MAKKINIKKYPKFITWVAGAPTVLCDQEDFIYNVDKVGEDFIITSDHNDGRQVVSKGGNAIYEWLSENY